MLRLFLFWEANTVRPARRPSPAPLAVTALVLLVPAGGLSAGPPQLPLPAKVGETFVVDDFESKVTLSDLGFNAFAGNMGGTETTPGILTLGLSSTSNPGPGGSLEVAFDFTVQGNPEAFAGVFASLFGLTDTLVSLDGSGMQPATTTPFPGFSIDRGDLFGDSLAFPDRSVEELRLDLQLLSGEDLVLKIELRDEDDFDVFTRRTLALPGGSWQTFSLQLPADFTDSVQGMGDPSAFDWSRISLLTILVERLNVAAGVSNPDTGSFLLDNVALVDTDGSYPDLPAAAALPEGVSGLDPQYSQAFLELVRDTSLLYFLDFASTELSRNGGLIQDRSTFADLLTLGGVGFQLTALVIAAERGSLPRQEAAVLARQVLRALDTLPQGPARVGTMGYRGFFYHFTGIDGLRKQNFDFTATTGLDESLNTVELSTIDTALAIAGVVTAGQYFIGPSLAEAEIRQRAGEIYARVEWPFLLEPASCQFYLGWKPNETRDDLSGSFGRFLLDDPDGLGQFSSKEVGGAEVPATLDFYTDEALLVALLAMGSPDPAHHPGRCVWDSTLRDAQGGGFVKTFPGALFTYEFFSTWLDTEALGTDNHPTPMNLFDNTRAAVAATRAYVQSNPSSRQTWSVPGGSDLWGLSAAEGPYDAYFASGAPTVALATDGGPVPGLDLALEAEDGTGDGVLMCRSNASEGHTIWLHAGESRTLAFETVCPDDLTFQVRYSNDNFGPLETVTVSLDGVPVCSFEAQDTGNGGNGWNVFVTADPCGPVSVAAGPHLLKLDVAGGDGFGVEPDVVTVTSPTRLRPLENGTLTNYGAAGAVVHEPQAALDALWRSATLGFFHPRFGFADAFNLDVADAKLPTTRALRTAGPWASFNGFAIDHGPMLILIDNHLNHGFIPRLFMSHPRIRDALVQLFPQWRLFMDGFETGNVSAWSRAVP